MKTNSLPTRRAFLRLSALALSAMTFPPLRGNPPASAPPAAPFIVGVNYPWAAYGHDFGGNAWGHDGMIAERGGSLGTPLTQNVTVKGGETITLVLVYRPKSYWMDEYTLTWQ